MDSYNETKGSERKRWEYITPDLFCCCVCCVCCVGLLCWFVVFGLVEEREHGGAFGVAVVER